MNEARADLIVIGGSAGGCAAALSALRHGLTVVMTEETAWIGGQFTSQAVPPDEHRYIERFGSSDYYRGFRRLIRGYYKSHFPLTASARSDEFLNPGTGECSTLSCEPRAALAAFVELLAPYVHSGRLRILKPYATVAANVDGDHVRAIEVAHRYTGDRLVLTGQYFLDGTDLGDTFPITSTEHVVGAESAAQTGEPHGAEGDHEPRTVQGITWGFAMDHMPGEYHVIEKPERYEYFRDHVPPHWPGSQLSFVALDYDSMGPWQHTFLPVVEGGPLWESLWTHRRLIDKRHFAGDLYPSDITLVNWTQNDYFGGPIVGVEKAESDRHRYMARQLSLSLMYWLQTDAPRTDGGTGFPGLRPRGDVTGTQDGLAMAPYIREGRRIQARTTVREQDISAEVRKNGPKWFEDSVGVGYYFLDMHQRTEGRPPFLVQVWPFQIPLGSLIPVRMRNLLPACKNIGVTHIVNSAFRLHPVEWSIGEAAGCLAAFCVNGGHEPHGVADSRELTADLQRVMLAQGQEIAWPDLRPVPGWSDHLADTSARQGG